MEQDRPYSRPAEFPLSGVIGVVANGPGEIEQAGRYGLQCVEMRPDLLLDNGFGTADILAMVEQIAQRGLGCLFTMRRHDHGGKFTGSHREQMEYCLQAVARGAHIVDVEWDSACARELISQGVATILSHHDFGGMTSATELAAITNRVKDLCPAAMKLVPTAKTFDDAVRILKWVEKADKDFPRIGFAMGAAGECSRILTRAFGGPITYAAFGAPVAPGQIAMDQLLSHYHADKLTTQTRVIGVVGEDDEVRKLLQELNQTAQASRGELVTVPLLVDQLDALEASAGFLRLDIALVSPSQAARFPNLVQAQPPQGTALVIDFRQGIGNSVVRPMGMEIQDIIAMISSSSH